MSGSELLMQLESALSSDSAFAGPVKVLTVEISPDGQDFSGKFLDVWNNRIFSYFINDQTVGYQPSVMTDISLGLDSVREDAGYQKRTKPPRCSGRSYGCGMSCISLTKICRINSGQVFSKERIIGLRKAAKGVLESSSTRKYTSKELMHMAKGAIKDNVRNADKNAPGFKSWNSSQTIQNLTTPPKPPSISFPESPKMVSEPVEKKSMKRARMLSELRKLQSQGKVKVRSWNAGNGELEKLYHQATGISAKVR